MVNPMHSAADQPQYPVEGRLDRESAEHPLSEASRVPSGKLFGVGFFSNLSDAEYAVTDLRSVSFPLNQIMVVAHSFRRQDQFTGVELCDRFEANHLGIPPEQVRLYEERLGCGNYMMIVRGTADDLNRIAFLLQHRGIQEWQVCELPAVNSESSIKTPEETVAVQDQPGIHNAQVNAQVAPIPVSSMPSISSMPVSTVEESNQVMMQHQKAIGVFSQRHDLEAALTELRDAGFPMDRISLIAKQTIAKQTQDHDRIAGVDIRSQIGNKPNKGAKSGSVPGGVGGLASLLIGLGVLAIPRIGSGRIRGATATTLMTMVAGMAIGAATGGLTGGLVGLGIPEDRAKIYNDRVARGDYLIRIDGTEGEIQQAEAVLHRHNIQEWGVYGDGVAAVNADVNTNINTNINTNTNINPAVNADVNADTNPDVNVIRSPEAVEQPPEAIERQPVLDKPVLDKPVLDSEPEPQKREPRIEHPLPHVTIIDRRDETRR